MLIGNSRTRILLVAAVIISSLCASCNSTGPTPAPCVKKQYYQPTWRSLRQYEIPQWLRDGKFGIYTHWGIYCVPAYGGNATWYSHAIYMDPDSEEREHHEKTYGPLDEFGYKDYIPMFKAEKFDADEWAELFQKAGARFAGPVAEHHDGFAMWDTKWSNWNAATMGPKRDVVGELEKAIKKRDMKFVTAFHHAANWFFFPVWDKRYDCSDPRYSGLYGFIHREGEKPSKEFIEEWHGKIIEVIDKYDPDFLWFDFALDTIQEDYIKDFLAYYYNKAKASGKEVVVTYKDHDLPPGVGLVDLELGQERDLTYHEWITDSTVDDQGAWGYVKTADYKSLDRLVDNLVDRVSKNGYLLLNVGPKADGTIPEEARTLLLGIGEWLQVNGEAIYETSPWVIAGEGPTRLGETGGFSESDIEYTAEDIRFTTNGNVLYATVLDWPDEEIVITTFRQEEEEDDDDEDDDEDEDDEDEDDEEHVSIDQVPAAVKATILKEAQGGTIEEIERETENGRTVYEAEVIINGQEVEIEVADDGTLLSRELDDEDDEDEDDEEEDEEENEEEEEGLREELEYLEEEIDSIREELEVLQEDISEADEEGDDETVEELQEEMVELREEIRGFKSEMRELEERLEEFEEEEEEEEEAPRRLLYESEIKSITMLGDGKQLKWKLTDEGLVIKTPRKKPCKHAYTFKIVRAPYAVDK